MSSSAAALTTTPVLVKNRIVAAIRGAFVADAASMGTHWIYDPAEMAKSVPSIESAEFKSPPTPKFYSSNEFPGHYETSGMLSPYGEQLLFVTEYCAEHGSIEGTELSESMLTWANTFGGRPDHALTQFVENMKTGGDNKLYPNCGADDDQAHIYMKMVPATCLYAGKPELMEKVSEAIRVHQNNAKAIAYGVASACILESVLLGTSLQDAIDKCNKADFLSGDDEEMKKDVLASLERARQSTESKQSLEDLLKQLSNEAIKDPNNSFYNLMARSCQLPGSFIGPMRQFFGIVADGESTVTEETYEKVLRENILVAGDTCSRSVFLGSVLAAASGGPPQAWLDKMDPTVLSKVNTAAEKIANLYDDTCTTTEEK